MGSVGLGSYGWVINKNSKNILFKRSSSKIERDMGLEKHKLQCVNTQSLTR